MISTKRKKIGLILLLFHIFYSVHCWNILDSYEDFFSCNTADCKSMTKLWHKEKRGIEAAIERDITEHAQIKIMNTFEKHRYVIGILPEIDMLRGFLYDDGMTSVLFRYLKIRAFPKLYNPRVTIALPMQIFRLEADLRPFFVRSTFMNFRNISNVIHKQLKDFKPYEESPFMLAQVPLAGADTIEVVGCQMIVLATAKIRGYIVPLSHFETKLQNCKFVIEIDDLQNTGEPPVVSPYFSDQHNTRAYSGFVKLVSLALQSRMKTLLENTMFTYFNLTSMFGNKLDVYRKRQRDITYHHKMLMTKLIITMNKISAEESGGAIPLEPLDLNYKTLLTDDENVISIRNVVLYGMDCAYAPHTGGPYKLKTVRIMDGIKFETLQVSGTLDTKLAVANIYNFSVEIRDLTYTIFMKDYIRVSLGTFTIKNVLWSYPGGDDRSLTVSMDKLAGGQLITAYIYNELQGTFENKLTDLLKRTCEKITSESTLAPQSTNAPQPSKTKQNQPTKTLQPHDTKTLQPHDIQTTQSQDTKTPSPKPTQTTQTKYTKMPPTKHTQTPSSIHTQTPQTEHTKTPAPKDTQTTQTKHIQTSPSKHTQTPPPKQTKKKKKKKKTTKTQTKHTQKINIIHITLNHDD